MRKLTLFLFASAFSLYANAQDFPWGRVDNAALNMTRYDKDTSAHAVFIQEYGTASINFTNDYHERLRLVYHAKIKFFDNKEFDNAGTFEIPIYKKGDGLVYEEVEDVKGITFYKDDNGLVQKAELDPKKVITVNEDKHRDRVKFAMPALRPGCVIEVAYTLVSPYFDDFRSWVFQGSIPKIYSEYEAHIPAMYNYNASLRGGLKLSKNKATVETKCFSYGTASCDCSDIIYGMSDVPALVVEDYMTSPKNFLAAINYELVEYTDLESGVKTPVSKDWKAVDLSLKTDEYFGSQLKRTSLMKDRIAPILLNKKDSMDKAKAIYAYLQRTIKWDGVNSYWSDGIRKALDEHKGNAGDINLALIASLNAGGIPTEAVLLSTRSHGTINNLYPNTGDFNYVIAKANIGGKSYLLDATDPLLPFGTLPLRCLNDKGRVFSLDKPSYWMDLNLPQREKTTRTLDFTLQENGKLKGTLTEYSMGYDAYEKRVAIKKYNSIDEYVEKINAESPKIKVIKAEVTNLDSLDQPLTEKYELEIDIFDKLTNKLAFNPFFWGKKDTNPFKLKERSYPVDWGMASDERMVLTIHLPSQYTVEAPPQALSLGMPNNGGHFITSYDPGDNSFTFSHVIQFNKSVYSSEEYPYLKELYNKIIQSEKAEMVFKKKS